MNIRGFHIPDLLNDMLSQQRLRRKQGSWPLRTDADHYGQHLETELSFVHPTSQAIEKATAELPSDFPVEEADFPDNFVGQPGYIPYITDFTAIMEFGISSDGASFCLDYRTNSTEPSVIWWDDVYWRRIAPSFADFISLFDLFGTVIPVVPLGLTTRSSEQAPAFGFFLVVMSCVAGACR